MARPACRARLAAIKRSAADGLQAIGVSCRIARPGQSSKVHIVGMVGFRVGKENDRIQFAGRDHRAKLLVAAMGAALQPLDRQRRHGFPQHGPGAAGADQSLAVQCPGVALHPGAKMRLAFVVGDQGNPPRCRRHQHGAGGHGQDRMNLGDQAAFFGRKGFVEGRRADGEAGGTGLRGGDDALLAIDAAGDDHRFVRGLANRTHQRRDIAFGAIGEQIKAMHVLELRQPARVVDDVGDPA